MMKKILALLLAVMMVMSLVACGNETPNETKPAPNTNTTTPSTESTPNETEPSNSDSHIPHFL